MTLTRPGDWRALTETWDWLSCCPRHRPLLSRAATAWSLDNHCIYRGRGEYNDGSRVLLLYLLNCHSRATHWRLSAYLRIKTVADVVRHIHSLLLQSAGNWDEETFPLFSSAAAAVYRVIISSMQWSRCEQCLPHMATSAHGHWRGERYPLIRVRLLGTA